MAAISPIIMGTDTLCVMQSIISLGMRAVSIGSSTNAGTRSAQNHMLFRSHSHQLCSIYRTFSREECNFFSTGCASLGFNLQQYEEPNIRMIAYEI